MRSGAVHDYYDLAHITQLAHDRHIWVVARIVSFKDPIVATANPAIAIRDVQGGIWKDGGGVPWLNQYNPRRLEVPDQPGQGGCAHGRRRGAVRLHALPERGRSLGDMRFPRKVEEPMDATIPRFLAAARKALEPYDVKLGIDVFGLAADHNLGIGQNIARIGKHVDVISPMLYPNHYTSGELGIIDPNADPSSTVALSMGTFRQQLIDSPKVKLRPWLQDFGRLQARRRCALRPPPRSARAPSAGCSGTRRWITPGARSARLRQPDAFVAAKLPPWLP